MLGASEEYKRLHKSNVATLEEHTFLCNINYKTTIYLTLLEEKITHTYIYTCVYI